MANLGYDRNFITGAGASSNMTAFNQFAGITNAGEPNYERQSYDNPPFMWPPRQYMNIAGDKSAIQRGYMRSLITDPQVSRTSATKNRRLFFQFNPQVLVRSVQQSVGAMNPLLQDPAQLVQPIPGTASFGFELFFNREKEVFTGAKSDFDMSLPDGSQALVSQIGVLADIMVLDTITGQGLSQDLVNYVMSYSKGQYDRTNAALKAQKEALRKAGATEADLATLSEYEKPSDKVLSDIFNANIGNSAFLNPLPFRVMFSSLFMVEGLATSVDVQFQKFSRTMVPTMCKVTINMYALYIGFAKKKTFLYDNLTNTTNTGALETTTDENVRLLLKYGLKKLNYTYLTKSGVGHATLRAQLDRTDEFKSAQKNQRLSDVKIQLFMYTVFHPTQSYKVPQDVMLNEANKTYWATEQTGEVVDIDLGKIVDGGVFYNNGFDTAVANSSDGYLSYQIGFTLSAKSSSGNTVTSDPSYFPIVSGIDKTNINVTNKTWTGNKPPAVITRGTNIR